MDRPIDFNSKMIRALLYNNKTQTRRVIKPKPPHWVDSMNITDFTRTGHITGFGAWGSSRLRRMKDIKLPCHPGDYLWVREAWKTTASLDGYRSGIVSICDPIQYVADGHTRHGKLISAGHERPPSELPRWASRMTLTVKQVKVERLQDITESDAEDEGVYLRFPKDTTGFRRPVSFRNEFKLLWNDIYGPSVYWWDENPWVCAITFIVDHAKASMYSAHRSADNESDA